MEKSKKPYISPSQLESYTRCGEAFRRRYLEKEIIPPGVAMVRGTAVHKGAEANFVQKVETRKDLPAKDIVDLSVTTFEETVKHEDVWLNPEEASVGKGKVVGLAKDATARLADLFATDLAPTVQPKFVEQTHLIELPNSSHDLLGRLDLVDENDAIDDLKTSGKRASQADVDKSTQLTFYAMTFQNKFKKPPTEIRYSQLLDLKTPAVNVVKTERGMDDFEPLVNRVNAVVGGIKAGVFAPASPGSWFCSPKWCGYYDSCPYVNSKKAVIG